MDPVTGAALIGGASKIFGKIGSLFGKKSAAKKQFKRTKYLRSTAYQATMKDMKKAGLNPILAYKQGATAAGAAQMAQVPDFGEGIGVSEGVATAKEKREGETATPLRKSQENVYLEQLENLEKQGRLLDQKWEAGEATAVESMIRAKWMAEPEGMRTVIRNYMGGTSVTGRGVAEGARIGRDVFEAIPAAEKWIQEAVEGAGGRPVDPNRQTWEQGLQHARDNPWFGKKKTRHRNFQDQKRRRPSR